VIAGGKRGHDTALMVGAGRTSHSRYMLLDSLKQQNRVGGGGFVGVWFCFLSESALETTKVGSIIAKEKLDGGKKIVAS